MGKKVNVYFSASSLYNQSFDLYRKIVDCIELAGGKILFNWLQDKKILSPQQVFDEAIKAIKSADVLVAEISTPSTGVGQQIAYSINNKVPVIALVNENAKEPSRFTLGTESELLNIVSYNETNLTGKLKINLDKLLTRKFAKFNFISTREINNYLEIESKRKNMSKSRYLRMLIEEKMGKLESKDE
jgi:hypothetical protein